MLYPSNPEFGPLTDFAVLGLIVGHGMDGRLDPSESSALMERLHRLAPVVLGRELSGDEALRLLKGATEHYGSVRIDALDALVRRVGGALQRDALDQAFRALVAVASADGHAHTMEHTILRHLHQAWELPPMNASTGTEPSEPLGG